MSFAFSFAGDDIDAADTEDVPASKVEALTLADNVNGGADGRGGPCVQRLGLDDVLHTLPSRISYYTTHLRSPRHGNQALVPRRALFDVRAQLMAEDDTHGNAGDLIGLGDSDLQQDVYEGGFKSWEGALDLAAVLLDGAFGTGGGEGREVSGQHVVELGCGTALPSLVLFQRHLSAACKTRAPLILTLADYNASVLRLVTVPNLLLVWALQHAPEAFSLAAPRLDEDNALQDGEGDLEITAELLARFMASSKESGITISLLAGPWSPELVDAIAPRPEERMLVLAAETIYSPASTAAFTKTLLDILRTVSASAAAARAANDAEGRCRALVAAKRVYFGVGGGVADFEAKVRELGGLVETLTGTGVVGADPDLQNGDEGGGVARWIGEVTLSEREPH